MASRFDDFDSVPILEVTEAEILGLNEVNVASSTKKATKFGLTVFRDWFQQQEQFTTPFEEMSPQELNKCLQKFYLSARKRDGSYYNKKSLMAIRSALDRHLKSPPYNKPFSIVADQQFINANISLRKYLDILSKQGDIPPTTHKQPITKEVIEKLYDAGELVEIDTLDPSRLEQTAWFFITLFLGKQENQHSMKLDMLERRETLIGEAYYEVSPEGGKIFERMDSKRCPFQIIEKYLSHLNTECENIFQKPRHPCNVFDPVHHSVWYYAMPVGHNTLENMLRSMTSRAGIEPYLTNHSVRATTIAVLSAANFENRDIRAITGSEKIPIKKMYENLVDMPTLVHVDMSPLNVAMPTLQQFKAMFIEIANYLDTDQYNDDNCINEDQAYENELNPKRFRTIIPKTVTTVASSSQSTANMTPSTTTTVTTATTGAATAASVLGFQDNQSIVRAFLPGSTFYNCTFHFNVVLPSDNGQHTSTNGPHTSNNGPHTSTNGHQQS